MNRRHRADQRLPEQTPPAAALEPITLGFVRGVTPRKWAERWAQTFPKQRLELVPVELNEVEAAREHVDVLLERVAPGARPLGIETDSRTRYAVRLYIESVALVVAADHELAAQSEVGLDDLALTTLLAHPDHYPAWPVPEPWQEPSWAPRDAEATLEAVATGVGSALLSFSLARNLAGKKSHAVIPVAQDGETLLPGTEIWASWALTREADDVQQLVGVLRGRTSRSSRNS